MSDRFGYGELGLGIDASESENVPITNYNRLVKKSPKELAAWLNDVESRARYYGQKGKDAWLDWLKQEVKE